MKLSLLAFCILIASHAQGQLAGASIYELSNVAATSRAAALGSQVIAINDGDIDKAMKFYNNLLDIDSAINLISDFHFRLPLPVVIMHVEK